MDSAITTLYGKRVRVRACGLCWKDNTLMMVNHIGLHRENFWAPPGGGVEFGQSAEETVIREFEEETGMQVAMGRFLFVCEFIKHPLHAIELFFEVLHTSGNVVVGMDPETAGSRSPVIGDARWMSWAAIKNLPAENVHGIFNRCDSPNDLMHLNAYYRI